MPTRDNLKELGVSKVKDLQQINGHTVAIEENFLLESEIAEEGLSAEDQEEIDTI